THAESVGALSRLAGDRVSPTGLAAQTARGPPAAGNTSAQNLRDSIRDSVDNFIGQLSELLGVPASQASQTQSNDDNGGAREHRGFERRGPDSDDADYWRDLYYDAFMSDADAARQRAAAQQRAQGSGT